MHSLVIWGVFWNWFYIGTVTVLDGMVPEDDQREQSYDQVNCRTYKMYKIDTMYNIDNIYCIEMR